MHKLIPALAALLAAAAATAALAQADTTGSSYGRFTVHAVGDSAQRVPTLVTRQGRGLLQFLCAEGAPVVVIGGADALGEGTVPVRVSYDGREVRGVLLAQVLSTGRTAVLPKGQTGDVVKGARGASSMLVRATTPRGEIEHTFALEGLSEGAAAVLPCAAAALRPRAVRAPADSSAPRPQRNLITEDELVGNGSTNVVHAIERLRPAWLRVTGTYVGGSEAVRFYVNGQYTSRAAVQGLPVSAVMSIRFLEPAQASVRFGAGHTEGAILVEMR